MGSGIAQVAAQAGWNVVLMDQSNDVLTHSSAALAKVCNRLVEKGRITADESVALQLRIDRTTEIQKLSSCILVIEAIVENVTVKQKVFASLENVVSNACLIATNTSSLSVTGLASSLQHPERFLGLHFFNPAPLMQLVEVVPAMQTDLRHVPRCIEWMGQWGKTPVQAKDTPGFIVNRLARPFYGEALRIVEEELATTLEVDAAMKAIGFRMGPFELMDLIGNDINYAVTVSVFEAFYFDPRYRPSLIQKQHVEAGWLGRKSGRGYYRYDGAPVASSAPNAMKDPEALEKFKNSTVTSLAKIANGGEKTDSELAAGPEYDRSATSINLFLGSPLGSDGDTKTGAETIAALKYIFHGATVNSPSDFTAAGQKITGSVFDMEKYEEAKQLKYKAIRVDKFGYDPKE